MTVEHYQLTLYVNGASDRSRHAIAQTRAFCEARLAGRFELRVHDLATHADAARDNGVLATPTVMVTRPRPPRRFVGTLTDFDHVALGLGLPPLDGPTGPVRR